MQPKIKTSLIIFTLLIWTTGSLAGQLDPLTSRQKPSVYLVKSTFTSHTARFADPVQITIVNNNPKVTTILRLINFPLLVGALLVPKENNPLRNSLLLTSIGISVVSFYFQFHKRKASLSSGSMLGEKG